MKTTLQAYTYSDETGGHAAYFRIPSDTLHVTKRHASLAGAKHAMKVWIADNIGGNRCRFQEVAPSQFRDHMANEQKQEAA